MIFFSADHHFCHANIIRYCGRPFASVEEMNEALVQRWNEVVGGSDTVYYLGDFSLTTHALARFLPQLNGEKFLVMGNHDVCHPCNKKKAEAALHLYAESGFKILGLEASLDICGEKVRLHHMPYQEDAGADGYVQAPKHLKYRPKDDGMWLLHGHVHEKWKTKDKMINVGVDVWDFCPVPLGTIEAIIAAYPARAEVE